MSYSDLKGKTFVVTGAASGMGRTTSILLAKQGANVALVDLRKPDNTQSFSNGVNDTHANGNITSSIAVACDARDRAAVEAALLQIVDHFGGPIHGAANMAGITGSGKEGVEALNDDDWDSVLGVNLDGVKNCLRAELKHMADGGAIVNAGSIAGQLAFPSMAPYCISKWGVLGLTKVAAQESGKRGIRVNAVAPGIIRTPMTTAIGPALFDAMGSKTALQRVAEPEEVSKVILFLLSQEASYINAAIINVDGGYQ